jgi:large subunit ribosomal protein L4
MQVKSYNQQGEETGTVELPEAVFGLKWNADLIHQVAMAQAANRRQGTAKVKDRAEVRGGGRKPWRQKGTGRARHGSIRSPIWRGGGITHGPRPEKNYKKTIPKKMARKALRIALSAKAREGEVFLADTVSFDPPKTKCADLFFKKVAAHAGLDRMRKRNGVLVAFSGKERSAHRILRNLPYLDIEEATNLTARDVLRYRYLLFSRAAIEDLSRSH